MEKVLPLDVLINIFSNYVFFCDILAIYGTCEYWRNIIDNCNIWKTHWYRLVEDANKSCLKEHTCSTLKQLNVDNLDLKYACLQLYHIIYNRYKGAPHTCFSNDNLTKKVVDAALLKTHHSHCILKCYEITETNQMNLGPEHNYMYANCKYHKPILNCINPDNNEDYIHFRSPQQITKNIDALNIDKNQPNLYHVHRIKHFFYFYPMALSTSMECHFLKHFFELYHVKEVILIPRVVMLCENLDIRDALVVYSTSRTTEIAVILNGCVAEGRWCELHIGGWTVAKNIYNACKWTCPSMTENICQLEDPKVKNLCWIKPILTKTVNKQQAIHGKINENSFTLKHEQYLAAEIMYTELELCTVIKKLLFGLPNGDIINCLSHVLLTGGNCKLKHFTRIKLDLIKTFPNFQNIISTSMHCDRSLVYQFPPHSIYSRISSLESMKKFEAGKKCRIKIEDYITVKYCETI